MKCHACTNVGTAHQCKLCKNNVYLICGNPEGLLTSSKDF